MVLCNVMQLFDFAPATIFQGGASSSRGSQVSNKSTHIKHSFNTTNNTYGSEDTPTTIKQLHTMVTSLAGQLIDLKKAKNRDVIENRTICTELARLFRVKQLAWDHTSQGMCFVLFCKRV